MLLLYEGLKYHLGLKGVVTVEVLYRVQRFLEEGRPEEEKKFRSLDV